MSGSCTLTHLVLFDLGSTSLPCSGCYVGCKNKESSRKRKKKKQTQLTFSNKLIGTSVSNSAGTSCGNSRYLSSSKSNKCTLSATLLIHSALLGTSKGWRKSLRICLRQIFLYYFLQSQKFKYAKITLPFKSSGKPTWWCHAFIDNVWVNKMHIWNALPLCVTSWENHKKSTKILGRELWTCASLVQLLVQFPDALYLSGRRWVLCPRDDGALVWTMTLCGCWLKLARVCHYLQGKHSTPNKISALEWPSNGGLKVPKLNK